VRGQRQRTEEVEGRPHSQQLPTQLVIKQPCQTSFTRAEQWRLFEGGGSQQSQLAYSYACIEVARDMRPRVLTPTYC